MRVFKKLSLFMILALICPMVVNAAGGISVSTKNISMEPNSTKTFTISATNAAGRVEITSSDSNVATVSSTSEFLDNNSVSITVSSKSAGTTTIKVTATDVATYDMEEVRTSYNITISVVAPETTSKTPTTTSRPPQKKPATKKTTTTKKGEKTTTTTTSTTTTSIEEPTTNVEESTTTKVSNHNGTIKLDEFRVVGYDLNKEDGKYILNIDEDVDEIYILASSKDESVKVSGTGIIDIKNKNRVVIDAEKDGINSKYIIKIEKKRDNASIIIGALIIIILGMLTYIIIDWKKNKSYR